MRLVLAQDANFLAALASHFDGPHQPVFADKLQPGLRGGLVLHAVLPRGAAGPALPSRPTDDRLPL